MSLRIPYKEALKRHPDAVAKVLQLRERKSAKFDNSHPEEMTWEYVLVAKENPLWTTQLSTEHPFWASKAPVERVLGVLDVHLAVGTQSVVIIDVPEDFKAHIQDVLEDSVWKLKE